MAHGFTLWFTGLSGSGKSTLANAVALEFSRLGRGVDLLDGDVVRQYLSKGLGFSKEDRDENIRRIGFVAQLITRNGGIAITAAISPYRSVREEVRALVGAKNFVEVYCECPVSECERRDVKGLYAKARAKLAAGEKACFTGLDDPYEVPLSPEISANTATHSVSECVSLIVNHLHDRGLLHDETDSEQTTSDSGITPAAHHEFIPEELLKKSEAAFKLAGKIHSSVLLKELHVGHATAAQIIDRLGEQGRIKLCTDQ
jgi:adenylyl-sulfate kinase